MKREKVISLIFIGMIVNMVFSQTNLVELSSMKFELRSLLKCVRESENEYLIISTGLPFYQRGRIDETGGFITIPDPGIGDIQDFEIWNETRILGSGSFGIGILNKNTAAILSTYGKSDGNFIASFVSIKETEYLCFADFNFPNKFQILNKNTLAFIRETAFTFGGNDIIHKRFTSSVHVINTFNEIAKSIDYTNLVLGNLIDLTSFGTDLLKFSPGRTLTSVIIVGRLNYVFEVDEVTQSLIQTIITLANFFNYGVINIFESEFIMICTDRSIEIVNLDTQIKQRILDFSAGMPCLNEVNLIFAVLLNNVPVVRYKTYKFNTASSCDDPNCLQCGFETNKCLKCGNGKILQLNECVDQCTKDRYYHPVHNTCYLDFCTGNKVYVYEKNECVGCSPGKIFTWPEKKCLSCKEKNKNCSQCKDGTLECEKCEAGYFLENGVCKLTCKSSNPSCKEFGENCKCLSYRCESKGCTNCPKFYKICEEEEIIDKRRWAEKLGSIYNTIIKYATPSVEIVAFLTSLITPDYGSVLIMSANRIVFTRRFIYINMDKGEIIRAYIRSDDKEVNNNNEKNMKFASNKFFEYVKSIYPSIAAYFKLILVWLVPLALILGLLLKKKKIGNKNYCLAIFYLKKGSYMVNFTSVTDLAFYVPGVVNNLILRKGWWNFNVWIFSIAGFVVHWIYLIQTMVKVKEVKASEVRVELEDLHSVSEEQNEEEGMEEEIIEKKNKKDEIKEEIDLKKKKSNKNKKENKRKRKRKRRRNKKEKEQIIDVNKTRKVIEKMNFPTIEFIRTPLRNKFGFEYSKYFQLINLFRNVIFLTMITAFPELPQITAYLGIMFEAQYLVTFIIIMWLYECFRPINLLQNLIHSFNLFVSYLIILSLHYSEKKSVTLQNFFVWFNFISFFLEIIFLILGIIVMKILKSHLDNKKEKRLRMQHAYIFEVIFLFK